MSDNIRVELTPEEMVQAVKKVFKKEHADLMGNCIVDILFEDGNGMESFFKATMGITPSVDYSVGDRVLCQADSMQDWRFDKEKMKMTG